MVGALGESSRHVARRFSDSATGSKAEHSGPASCPLVGQPLPGAAVNPMKFFFDYDRSELAKMFTPPFRATQIFKAVYQHGIDDFEAMTDLPKVQRASLAQEWDIKLPAVHRRFDSVDGTRRYLVRLHDAEMAETVFIPEE